MKLLKYDCVPTRRLLPRITDKNFIIDIPNWQRQGGTWSGILWGKAPLEKVSDPSPEVNLGQFPVPQGQWMRKLSMRVCAFWLNGLGQKSFITFLCYTKSNFVKTIIYIVPKKQTYSYSWSDSTVVSMESQQPESLWEKGFHKKPNTLSRFFF